MTFEFEWKGKNWLYKLQSQWIKNCSNTSGKCNESTQQKKFQCKIHLMHIFGIETIEFIENYITNEKKKTDSVRC